MVSDITVLEGNKTLRSLDIDRDNIGVEDSTALAKALEDNNTLQSLDIGNSKIGNEGCTALDKVLDANSTLQELSIGNNKFRDEGCTASSPSHSRATPRSSRSISVAIRLATRAARHWPRDSRATTRCSR